MARKDIEIIQGDSFTLGFRVSGVEGPVDFTLPDVAIYAQITDLAGRKVIAEFQIIDTGLVEGSFRIFLSSAATNALRGKHLWSVRYERGTRVTTLAGGEFIVKVAP